MKFDEFKATDVRLAVSRNFWTSDGSAREAGPAESPPPGPDGIERPPREPQESQLAGLHRVDDKTSIPGLLGSDWTTYRQLVDSKRHSATIVSDQYFSHRLSSQHSPRDHATHNPPPDVVEVCVFWVAGPHSPDTGARQPSSGRGRIVVQRVAACAPSETSAETSHTSPTGESRESDLVTERLQDACDDYLAKRLMDPAWEKFANGWATPVCENMASAAETISGLREQVHQLVLGSPIENLTGMKPLGSIGAEVSLPVTRYLEPPSFSSRASASASGC